MSMRRAGDYNGHNYRCWIEPLQGKYRAWFRGNLTIEIGEKNLVDRLHGSTDWFEDKESALDDAEARMHARFDEVLAEIG
ncbi:MAG: hypothetical protein GKS06_19365 [Acidobacteria bacterium]|nr:hypothetical protein [Acidobacteriota bacterium]